MKTITMERHHFFLILCLLIIPLLGTLFIMYDQIKNPVNTQPIVEKSPRAQITLNLPNSPDIIPISSKNSHVTSGSIEYTLQGKIVKVSTNSVTIDSLLPALPLTKDVTIMKRSKLNTTTKTSFSSLKEDTSVSITTTYDLKTQKWHVLAITIL